MKTLKKIAIVVVALLVCAGSADAKILRFGIKGGLNVNKLSLSKDFAKDLTSPSNSTGWEAGVVAEANIPIIGLGFDLSLMYARMNNSTQAYYVTNSGIGNEVFNGKNVGKNFIMLPINIKYKFNLPAVSQYISPYIFTGPNFLFKLDKEIINSMKTKTCQVAWNVGLGVELIRHLQIGASYNFGINNIAKHFDNEVTDLNVKNNYWMVTAAWLF